MASSGGKTEDELKYMRIEYCKTSSKFILTNVGLGLIMIIYTIIGAIVFQNLETTNEKEQCIALMNKYIPMENKTALDLWYVGNSYQSADDKDNALIAIEDLVINFRNKVNILHYDGTNCTELGEVNGPQYQWSFSGSVLFAVTVFTTVGYGNIAPKTFWGRLVCIVYALIGTPLMLVFLANIGEIMADVFRFVYSKVCCCGCFRQRTFTNQKENCSQNEISKIKNDDEFLEDEDDQLSVPITLTMTVIAGYLFMGSLLFGTWEGWSMLQSAYYCFITITTIGFGDVVPGTSNMNSTSGQMIMVGAALYMIFGMAIMSMAFNLIQEEMVGKFVWISDKLGLTKTNEYDNSLMSNQTTGEHYEKKDNSYLIASPMEAPYPVYKSPNEQNENLKHMLREPSSLTNWAAAAISQNSKK